MKSMPVSDFFMELLTPSAFILIGMFIQWAIEKFVKHANVPDTDESAIPDDFFDPKTGMVDHKYLPQLEIIYDPMSKDPYFRYSNEYNAYGANMAEDKEEV